MQLGDLVWSKKLNWCISWGEQIKKQTGYYKVYSGFPYELTVRRARRKWRCEDCGKEIPKGTLHGSSFYAHYCLDCVTTEKPQWQWKPIDE